MSDDVTNETKDQLEAAAAIRNLSQMAAAVFGGTTIHDDLFWLRIEAHSVTLLSRGATSDQAKAVELALEVVGLVEMMRRAAQGEQG